MFYYVSVHVRCVMCFLYDMVFMMFYSCFILHVVIMIIMCLDWVFHEMDDDVVHYLHLEASS
jgi:hypothetical protein